MLLWIGRGELWIRRRPSKLCMGIDCRTRELAPEMGSNRLKPAMDYTSHCGNAEMRLPQTGVVYLVIPCGLHIQYVPGGVVDEELHPNCLRIDHFHSGACYKSISTNSVFDAMLCDKTHTHHHRVSRSYPTMLNCTRPSIALCLCEQHHHKAGLIKEQDLSSRSSESSVRLVGSQFIHSYFHP